MFTHLLLDTQVVIMTARWHCQPLDRSVLFTASNERILAPFDKGATSKESDFRINIGPLRESERKRPCSQA